MAACRRIGIGVFNRLGRADWQSGSRYLDMVPLKLIAGIGFVATGCWAIVEHFRGA